MIYGYDNNTDQYLVMGYRDKIVAKCIPRKNVKMANMKKYREIIRYKRNINMTGGVFDVEVLEDFVFGKDSKKIVNVLQAKDYISRKRGFILN